MSIANAPTLIKAPLHQLVYHLLDRLAAGQSVDNPRLTAAAQQFFGGSRGEGAYSPKDAYDAMECAANLYLLDGRAEKLLATPTSEALSLLKRFTDCLATQSDRTHEQVEFQQFSTPPAMAFIVARLASVQPEDIVLEPSAGTGNLAVWARAAGATVHVNEIATSPRRLELLRLLGFDPHDIDAEMLDDLLPDDIKPTVVMMNPPFSSTAGRTTKNDSMYGAKHVEQALRRLQDKGRLVAILFNGMALNASKFQIWWQRIASTYNVRANITVGGREYAKFGTSVETQIVVIDKDGRTPGDGWVSQANNILWGRASSLAEAWEKLEEIAVRTPRDEQAHDEQRVEVFAPYAVRGLTGGKPHPAEIVESASMAAVSPPAPTYRPHLPASIVEDGKLSLIQLESVIYAGQRHEQRLANGERGGFFVGHSTGVGKGRILAAVIADNWNQGRRRALWLSVNNDLMPATRRDLVDIGSGNIPLARINDYQADGEIGLLEGVLFSSYSSLISQSKKGRTRLEQITEWLGKDGVIVFDESSKAKNLIAGRGDGTQTAQAVVDLQNAKDHPEYRIVYSSATGATEVRNMAYMQRLGLWGPGTAFPGGFVEFLNEIEDGGVGAMEMVSRDLKSLGMYLSGSISFGMDPVSGKAVEYRELIHRLTDEQREMYDCAARAWQHCLKNIDEAVKVTGAGKKQRSNAMSKFWGDHQRFFCNVITAFKVPALIAEIERALADGKSVVASLVSTGEARTKDQVGRAVASGENLEDLDFTPREVILTMIERAFPTTQYQSIEDPITKRIYEVPATDKQGNEIQSKEALRMKQDLLDGLSAMRLPENPLDQIINYFGPERVAELTGRTRRLVRDKLTGRVTYGARVPEGVAMNEANQYEMAQFQSGRKRIAIISDAASMGISLHASNRCENRQRRVHITLQLGWSADKQMQTFGRTHRSDQAVPPEYVLLCTELGGERRFCSTIARRLGSLGALTKGERLAADSGDLAKYNFETSEGRSALQCFFRTILGGEEVPRLEDAKQTLRDMGLLLKDKDGKETVKNDDQINVPRFLNRVLALEVDRQNAIFEFFAEIFERTVFNAKAMGTFDEGVVDIRALAIRNAAPPRVIARDEITGALTAHYHLDVDYRIRTCPFEDAEIERASRGGQYVRNRKAGFVALAVPDGRTTDAKTGMVHNKFCLWRPKESKAEWRRDNEIDRLFVLMTPEDARILWEAEHGELPKVRTVPTHIIGGAILPLWRRIKSEKSSRLWIVRVATDDGQRIVGAKIDPERVGPVLRAVGVSRNLKTPQEIKRAILEEGDTLPLVNNLFLHKRLFHKEPYVAIGGNVRYQDYQVLRGLGMYNEYVSGQGSVFYVPTGEAEWETILGNLLKQFPPLKSSAEVESELRGEVEAVSFKPLEPVHISQLLVPVAPYIEPEPEVETPASVIARAENVPAAKPVNTRSKAKRSGASAKEQFNYLESGQGLLF